MTFEEFWKENYEKEFGTSEPYYGIASYAFEKGHENCNCVYTDNSNVIQKLEKENAELKSIADFQTTSNMDRYFLLKRNKEQLTKAKELLERLLITSCNSDVLNLLPNCSEVLRVRVEAEQFLKERE